MKFTTQYDPPGPPPPIGARIELSLDEVRELFDIMRQTASTRFTSSLYVHLSALINTGAILKAEAEVKLRDEMIAQHNSVYKARDVGE